MDIKKPVTRPKNACFSSGPVPKTPYLMLVNLQKAPLGRSHRAKIGKAKLKLAIEETRKILEIPNDYKMP
jgi:phosphoserine aminotransferase